MGDLTGVYKWFQVFMCSSLGLQGLSMCASAKRDFLASQLEANEASSSVEA